MDPDTSLSDKALTYEDVATCAQKFLSARPVVVLGTGATIPHGLPSMAELVDKLLKAIGNGLPNTFAQQLRKTKDLERTLNDDSLADETANTLAQEIWNIVSAKDLAFYQQLLQGDISFPLADMFKYLLRTADGRLQVVTTNYDRVAEYAANYVCACASTGMTPGWIQRFVPTSVNEQRRPSPRFEGLITILKVHGSLDWFRNVTDDVVAAPLSRAIPPVMKPLIVIPGSSKYREAHNDPFRTIIGAADTTLKNATCYVCVGYGFNDEHVQPVLMNRVKKCNVPLLVVTKKLTDQTRDEFLADPPKKFLFLEEANGGTMAYMPKHLGGALVDRVSVWQLDNFMDMIEGK